MLGLLVTGHGHFATGLGSSLELIAGAQPNVALVDFEADHSIEILKANLEKALDSLKEYEGVLILSDLPGGSPFNTAVVCKSERQDQAIEVIAGTNLPLLIASSTMASAGIFDNPLDLAEAMIPEGKDSIVRFALAARVEEEEEDGI